MCHSTSLVVLLVLVWFAPAREQAHQQLKQEHHYFIITPCCIDGRWFPFDEIAGGGLWIVQVHHLGWPSDSCGWFKKMYERKKSHSLLCVTLVCILVLTVEVLELYGYELKILSIKGNIWKKKNAYIYHNFRRISQWPSKQILNRGNM